MCKWTPLLGLLSNHIPALYTLTPTKMGLFYTNTHTHTVTVSAHALFDALYCTQCQDGHKFQIFCKSRCMFVGQVTHAGHTQMISLNGRLTFELNRFFSTLKFNDMFNDNEKLCFWMNQLYYNYGLYKKNIFAINYYSYIKSTLTFVYTPMSKISTHWTCIIFLY